MATYKASSIVLKSCKLGEADKIVRLFSIEHGIINAVAKGACNFKSKFSGRLELYNVIDSEISRGRNLDVISQAEIIEIFQNISSDFFKFNIAQIISEIILKTQSEGSSSVSIFRLVYVVLKEINRCAFNDSTTLKKILAFFIAKLLKIMGYVPLFETCSICSRKLYDKEDTYDTHNLRGFAFSIKYGGAICDDCRRNAGKLLFVDSRCSNELINLFILKIEDIVKCNISEKNMKELLYILENYFIYHTETNIESFNYLKKIENI
ncbi:MAG: DNA repair protein RecO [Actinobacteria bacterium]|nr:DNA repair protein RecO [Actinomycetota bacterium]MCL6087826.1 DNA repair protein RecO [Actinomycetota bacterium]